MAMAVFFINKNHNLLKRKKKNSSQGLVVFDYR